MIEPLTRPSQSNSHKVANVAKAAKQCNENLSTFREQWTSEQTRDVLARSEASVKKDGDLSKGVDVARYGWS